MSYNTKLVRTDSYLEVWQYEKPIFSNYKKINHEDKEKNPRRKFEELTDEEQLERMKRMSRTRQKTKWNLLRLVDTNFDDSTSFLTLTTKENIQERTEFNQMLDKFIKRLNYNLYKTKKRIIKYIAVLERQKRGAWHAHILLFDFPFVPHEKLLKLWKHGAVRINKVDVDSKDNRGRYVTKYFEKGIGQELLESMGKKAYYSSHNLKKPEEIKLLTNETLEDLFDLENVVYESEYVGKSFHKGEYEDNPVSYKKIKLNTD